MSPETLSTFQKNLDKTQRMFFIVECAELAMFHMTSNSSAQNRKLMDAVIMCRRFINFTVDEDTFWEVKAEIADITKNSESSIAKIVHNAIYELLVDEDGGECYPLSVDQTSRIFGENGEKWQMDRIKSLTEEIGA